MNKNNRFGAVFFLAMMVIFQLPARINASIVSIYGITVTVFLSAICGAACVWFAAAYLGNWRVRNTE